MITIKKESRKRLIISKSSQSHIEIILSFIIFVGFVFAIFAFFKPVDSQKISLLAFERMQQKIVNNLSISYQFIPLILSPGLIPSSKSCFKINNSYGKDAPILVKNSSGGIVYTDMKKKEISLNTKDAPGKFFYIYLSNNTNTYTFKGGGCQELDESNYSFGAFTYETAILLENIYLFNNQYMANYEKLKVDLGLENNFEFVVSDLNRNIILNDSLSKNKLKTGNVLAREFLFKAVDKNLTQVNLRFSLRVW